jgi:hypothetical protein
MSERSDSDSRRTGKSDSGGSSEWGLIEPSLF